MARACARKSVDAGRRHPAAALAIRTAHDGTRALTDATAALRGCCRWALRRRASWWLASRPRARRAWRCGAARREQSCTGARTRFRWAQPPVARLRVNADARAPRRAADWQRGDGRDVGRSRRRRRRCRRPNRLRQRLLRRLPGGHARGRHAPRSGPVGAKPPAHARTRARVTMLCAASHCACADRMLRWLCGCASGAQGCVAASFMVRCAAAPRVDPGGAQRRRCASTAA